MTSWMSVRNWARGALVTAASVLAMAQAEAYTVSLTPGTQTVEQGTVVAIGVTVSDLGPLGLGSYNFDLAFDGTILGFDRVVDAFGLGISFGLDFTAGAGTFSVSDFSLEDPSALLVRQGADLTLFTLYFNTLAAGTSALNLTSGILSDVNGDIVSFLTNNASVTVTEPTGTPVSQPGTLVLLLAAATAAALTRRRSQASS